MRCPSDSLGLGRFREKYAAKMSETPDAHVFEIVSAPLGTSGDQFAAIAHAATSIDTLEGFLRDMKARYPDANSPPMISAPMASAPSGAPPQASAQPPDTRPAAPVLPPVPPGRASGHSAQNVSKPGQPSAKKGQPVLARSGRVIATAALENRVP